MNKGLRKGIACLLGCTMLFHGEFRMWNNKNEVQAATEEDIRLEGIDVSHHQKQIDWAKVKEAGIDYAIIRCGYGQDITLQDDIQWKANAEGCTEQRIPFGVYLYSYATTVEAAKGEADHVLRLIEGYDLQYPVYYDIEYSKQKELSAEELGKIASAFAEKIEDAGYQVGIYASYSWFQKYLTDPVFDQWERWVARYNTYCGYSKDYSMWQYSSSGTVSGIDSSIKVDMDYVIGTDVITKVEEISCDKTKLELQKGESAFLAGEVIPKNALNKNINWKSSDEKVVTVSAQGEVKAVGEGTAQIVLAAEENSNIALRCNVTVSNNVKPIETVVPTKTPEITKSSKPVETKAPEITKSPKPKETKIPTKAPEITKSPKPEETKTPTKAPEITKSPKPEETKIPTKAPEITKSPKPEETKTPTKTPEITKTPKPTEIPKQTITVKEVKGFDYQALSKNEIKLSWKKVAGVEGYRIYRYDKVTKKDILLTTIKKNQITNYHIKKINGEKGKKLSPGMVYTYKIEAYKTVTGKKYYSNKVKISAVTKPDTVKIKKVKRTGSTKARVQWKSVSRATGYVVYISNTKNGTYQAYKTVVGKKKKNLTISNLKKKKTYYVRVCAYFKHGDNLWYGNYYKTMKISAK